MLEATEQQLAEKHSLCTQNFHPQLISASQSHIPSQDRHFPNLAFSSPLRSESVHANTPPYNMQLRAQTF